VLVEIDGMIGVKPAGADGAAVRVIGGAAHAEWLGYRIAHRPGFVAPTLTACAAATLDHVTNGCVALDMPLTAGGASAPAPRAARG
jgi:alkanesulfonate monooxygenase